MAYNRDWDKGKDNWGDSGAWFADRGSRGRDDDSYGDGKRRKFNNGVRDLSAQHFLTLIRVDQGYDTSHSYEEPGYETSYNQQPQGRTQDYAQDYSHDDRQQKGFQGKKRLVPSEPSPHVIFLGLDPDFSEADVCRRALHIFEYRAESMLYFSCRHTYRTMDATLKRSPS